MKKYIFTFIFAFLITNSLLFPRIALEAATNGIQAWFYQILPALLPFTILSGIFLKSKWLDSSTKYKQISSNKTSILPILIILLCGTIFGFPIGAKLSCDFYKQGYICKSQAEILSICTNNFSPMYVNGFVIPLLFDINTFVYPILFLLYAIPVLIGGILLMKNAHTTEELSITSYPALAKKTASRFQLDMQIIDAGIISGFETLIKICGYIVLFSLLTSFCKSYVTNVNFPIVCVLGNLEISNGITLLSEFQTTDLITYLLMIQFLSFGGISGLAQTASFLSPARLSVKKYILGKIALSGILTSIAILFAIIYQNQR